MVKSGESGELSVSVAANPYASASLYVGNLSPEVTEGHLFERFNTVGPVGSIRVCRDSQTRHSLGYAYVNFHSVSDAERALDTMNFQLILGRQCRIMWSQRDPTLRRSGEGNVFVKNLHESITDQQLHDSFSLFGDILSCKVKRDITGKSLRCGYVHYTSSESAKKAIENVHGMAIANQRVEASHFKPREQRERERPFTNVYIKFIPDNWSSQDLEQLIRSEIKNCDITSLYWQETEKGKFSCVNFRFHKHAQECVDALDGKKFNTDKPLYVVRSVKKKLYPVRKPTNHIPRRKYSGVNLYIKNLSLETDDFKLKELFETYGPISSVRVMIDPDTKRSRGFGFVCFVRKEDAVKAMTEMNSKIIDNKPLYVSRAQKKAVRQAWLLKQRNRMKMTNSGAYGSANNYGNTNSYGNVGNYGNIGNYGNASGYGYGSSNYGPPSGYDQHNPIQASNFIAPGFVSSQRSQLPQTRGFAQQMYPALYMQQHPQFSNPPHMQTGYPSQVQQIPSQPTTHPIIPNSYSQTVAMTNPQQHSASLTNQPANISNPQHSSVPQQGSSVPTQQVSVPTTTQMSAPQAMYQQLPKITRQDLQKVSVPEQKRMVGERLFPQIQRLEPRLAGKITGMLLEMENHELLILLENNDALTAKVNEALQVLREHHAQSAGNQPTGRD